MGKIKFNPFTGNLDFIGDIAAALSFNGNRPVTRQGISGLTGQTLGGSTFPEFLEGFFTAIPPGASLQALNSTRLFGAPVSVTLNWTATKNTNPITSITVDSQQLTVTGETQSGSKEAIAAQNIDTTFSMNVTAGATSANALAYVLWRHYRFWFKSSVDLLALSDIDISAFLNSLPAGTFEFATSKDQPSRAFSCAGEYIYFANQAALGTPSFFVNGLANNGFIEKTLQFANPYNYTSPLKLNRSGNILTGSYNVDAN